MKSDLSAVVPDPLRTVTHHRRSVPTSSGSLSTTVSVQVPAAFSPTNRESSGTFCCVNVVSIRFPENPTYWTRMTVNPDGEVRLIFRSWMYWWATSTKTLTPLTWIAEETISVSAVASASLRGTGLSREKRVAVRPAGRGSSGTVKFTVVACPAEADTRVKSEGSEGAL